RRRSRGRIVRGRGGPRTGRGTGHRRPGSFPVQVPVPAGDRPCLVRGARGFARRATDSGPVRDRLVCLAHRGRAATRGRPRALRARWERSPAPILRPPAAVTHDRSPPGAVSWGPLRVWVSWVPSGCGFLGIGLPLSKTTAGTTVAWQTFPFTIGRTSTTPIAASSRN